eukprot:3802067-Rhodomonas_salina.1
MAASGTPTASSPTSLPSTRALPLRVSSCDCPSLTTLISSLPPMLCHNAEHICTMRRLRSGEGRAGRGAEGSRQCGPSTWSDLTGQAPSFPNRLGSSSTVSTPILDPRTRGPLNPQPFSLHCPEIGNGAGLLWSAGTESSYAAGRPPQSRQGHLPSEPEPSTLPSNLEPYTEPLQASTTS